MNYIDYVIFGVLVVAFILGFKDGLIRKLIGLAGIIIGIILAVKFSGWLGSLLAPIFDNEIYFARIAAGFIIFILIIILAAVIKRIVHPHDKVNKMVNQVLGGVTGILQVLFILSGALFLLAILNVPNKIDQKKSLLYGSVYSVVPKSIDFIIGKKGYVNTFMEKKENKTDQKIVTQNEPKKSLTVKENNPNKGIKSVSTEKKVKNIAETEVKKKKIKRKSKDSK